MPDDKYKVARAARNASRIVVEGVDEPSGIASHVPPGYTSPDVEDKRNDFSSKAMGWLQHKLDPLKVSKP